MLISVHVGKTAGSSFGKSLLEHYGDRMLSDYGNAPMSYTRFQRRANAVLKGARSFVYPFSGIECIQGHFLPIKYLALKYRRNAQFITWMRDPVERVASHYHYWKRLYDPTKASTLQRRLVEEDWSLERFCLHPQLQNAFSEYYWLFPLEKFDFVGVMEHYDEDFAYFSKCFFGKTLEVRRDNVNPDKGEGYVTDPDLRARIEAFHADDMALYKKALALRESRP